MVTINYINIDSFIKIRNNALVLDVRTPAEFEKGHVPGAVNLSLFNNDDRVKIGTLYKKKGRQAALKKGFELVGPKLKGILETAEKIIGNKEAILYCWRGGLRSYTLSWLLQLYGLRNKVLSGGYKSYRRYLKSAMDRDAKICILSGMTGCGKTEMLKVLKTSGHQIIDLEGLANHKGSAFGCIGKDKQYPNEHFENLLGEEWIRLNKDKTIWIEDEGRNIGSNYIPDEIFSKMRTSPVIKIDLPIKYRIGRLNREYANYNKEELKKNIQKITKRLGGQNAIAAIKAVDENRTGEAIEIVLKYYDKAYNYGLSKRDAKTIYHLKFDHNDIESNTFKLIKFWENIYDEQN